MTTDLPRPYRPVALIVLDGWGLSDCQRPGHNAIANARTPNVDRWLQDYPHRQLGASGPDVGVKPGQMGDSNVGHLNLGAGRIVYQDVVRIDRAIASGELGRQPALRQLLDLVRDRGSTLHLAGLVSDGGVHSHIDHLQALLKAAGRAGVQRLRVHAFLDGRDVPPKSAGPYLEAVAASLAKNAAAVAAADWALGSLAGRYYAMDRDNRWERTRQAYEVITGSGSGAGSRDPAPELAPTAGADAGDGAGPTWSEALARAYERGETDEFVTPVMLARAVPVTGEDGVLFFNFRADRGRQLARALVEPEEVSLGCASPDGDPPRPAVTTMTRYDASLDVPAIFSPQDLANTLGQVVAAASRRQLRLAETEKYAHVTFFFSGGREEPFAGEDRVLVPSPDVATYDHQPEMSASEVTAQALAAVRSERHDLLVINYANCDMVGHSGDYDAAVEATEAVDTALGPVVEALLAAGGAALIVADHGNAEAMTNCRDGTAHTAHTSNPVPALLIAGGLPPAARLRPGVLADVAPTVLQLMGLPQPPEMDGRSLLMLC